MRVVIVGASSGIGFHTARLLKNEGHEVVNISRTKAKDVDSVYADAATSGSIEQAIKGVGSIDALIYCAGYSMASPVEYARENDYRYLFDVNFFGAIEAIRAATQLMKTGGGGKIILISSMASSYPIIFDAFYSASKAALESLGLAAAMELRPFNIRISTIKPGGVSTRFSFKRKVYSDDEVNEYALKQRQAVAALNLEEQTGMNPRQVASCVYSILTRQNPPLTIACGAKNKARLFATRLMPTKALLNLNFKKYEADYKS